MLISLRQVEKIYMVKLNLTQQEELLMKRVCELQLDSFERILSGKGEFDLLVNFRDALDFNIDSLSEHSTHIPTLLSKLDYAMFISQHKN